MKLLLIGGSGQLSGCLAQMALAQGHEVWTVTRGVRPLPEGVHSLMADREDAQALQAALAAANTRWDALLDCVCRTPHHAQVNLTAVSPYVRRMVIVSTDSVYSPYHKNVPQDEHADVYMTDGGYGHNKRLMEQVFEASDQAIDWTIFRPGHILGPGFWLGCYPEQSRQPDLLQQIRAGKPMRLVGGGEFLIHPIFVDDMAQAMLDCIDKPAASREIFCIGGPDAVPNRRYYELIGQITGCPVTFENIPLEGYLEAHPEYSGHLCHRCYTLDKMKGAGIPLPKTTLEEALRQHIQWLDERETKTIYLAGGCYWGVEKYTQNIPGVMETEVGFANGNTENPTYQQVRYENTGHAETVRVVYNANQLPLEKLLRLFFRIIDPVSVDQQGEDIGHQYRTGVYHQDAADVPVIRHELAKLEAQVGQPLAVEACPLEHFYPAEEYHQKYLDKNPRGYCHVPWAAIHGVKDVRLEDV